MSGAQEEGRIPSLVALRSGIASAEFERRIRDAQAAQDEAQSAQLALHAGQVEPPAQGDPDHLDQKRPLVRRLGRRILRSLRPLALPVLHRFHLNVSHAVGISPPIQHQTILLQEVRDLLAHVRGELEQSIAIRDIAIDVSRRLNRQEEELMGLRALAVANLRALTDLAEADSEADDGQSTSVEPRVDWMDVRRQLGAQVQEVRDEQVQQRQLIERILRSGIVPLGDEVLIRTSFGWLLVPRDDHPIITAMGEMGDALEPGTVHVIRSILRPGDLAIDVGANVGGLLLPMARSVGREGGVIACEPSPTCMRALRKTAALNGLEPSLVLHQVAVGSSDGVATLHLGSNSSLNSIVALPGATGTIEVQIKKLDDIVPVDRRPSLVKVDVEGLELEVLRGMRGILDRSPDISLIAEFGPEHLSRNGISTADWIAEFESFGFTLWMIDEKDGTLTGASTASLHGIYSVNILMVRQDLASWPQLRVAS